MAAADHPRLLALALALALTLSLAHPARSRQPTVARALGCSNDNARGADHGCDAPGGATLALLHALPALPVPHYAW